MTADINTLNGSLATVGEALATQLTNKNIPALAEEGLTTLIEKIAYTSQKKQIMLVNIVWSDDNNRYNTRPHNVNVGLYLNTQSNTLLYRQKITSDDNWLHLFELPYYDEDLIPFQYVISSADDIKYDSDDMLSSPTGVENLHAIDGYTITKTIDNNIITFYCSLKMTDVRVEIIWDDNNDAQGMRPARLSVAMYEPAEFYETFSIDSSTNWQLTTHKPEYRLNDSTMLYELSDYNWTEGSALGYRVTSTKDGNITIFTNKLVTIPPSPTGG